MRNKLILFVAIIILTISCKQTPDSFAKNLIKEFKTKSINKDDINWTEFEREVLKNSMISKDSAIVTALTLNNNPHTYYMKKKKILYGDYKLVNKPDTCNLYGKVDIKRFKDVGYLKIKSFYQNPFDQDADSSNEYIKEVLDSIKKQDRKNLKGWIIDLRYNSGGDMWPMLVSTTPFFSSQILGYFKVGKQNQRWKMENDEILLDNDSQNERLTTKKVKYRILNKDAKIAVLINSRTKSAGEALAIAFKSVKRAKFFGLKTYGFATSNKIIHLNKDEILVMTSGYMADVNRKIYPNGLFPDVRTCLLSDLDAELYKWFLN